MTDDDFFSERREWSRWKHRLLYRYLGKFAAILGSQHKTIYYIDGFAGSGRYVNPEEDGSPVIAARLAVDARDHRVYALRCINVEPAHYDDLVAATTSVAPALVDNRQGTFREHLPDILSTIGNAPALFFLDPYGHKGMEWDVVTAIAARARGGPATEVLLNLYSPKIDRNAGWMDSIQKAGPAFVERVNRLFGTDEWQPLYSSTPDYQARMAALAHLYMRRLADSFSGIASRFQVRTLTGTLKYYLVHGTHSVHGGRAMSDVVYRVSEEYEQEQVTQRRLPVQQLDLFPSPLPTEEQRDEAIHRRLSEAIYALRARRSSWTFQQLQEELLPDWFGRAVEKHYRAACRRLIDNDKARLAVPSGQRPGRGSRGGINASTILELL